MTVTPAGASPGDAAFIRAGGGVQLNPRRLAGILVWLLVALLAGLAVYFSVTGAQQNSQLNALRQRGVPVQATVTGCRGISSGVGMGIEYWECRGSYTLDGHSFGGVINGSRKLLESGVQVPAIAVPGRPDLLSTVSSVRGAHGAGTQYGAAVGLGVAAVLVAAGWLAFGSRRRRSSVEG
jgi:hypothetical protein